MVGVGRPVPHQPLGCFIHRQELSSEESWAISSPGPCPSRPSSGLAHLPRLILAQLIKLFTTCCPDSRALSLEGGPRPSLGISSQCLHSNRFQLRGSPAPSFLRPWALSQPHNRGHALKNRYGCSALMDFITSQAGDQMPQNRARGKGRTAPGRPTARVGSRTCTHTLRSEGCKCTPFCLASASLGSCFTKHGAPQTASVGCRKSPMAQCLSTAQPSTSQPGDQGPKVSTPRPVSPGQGWICTHYHWVFLGFS